MCTYLNFHIFCNLHYIVYIVHINKFVVLGMLFLCTTGGWVCNNMWSKRLMYVFTLWWHMANIVEYGRNHVTWLANVTYWCPNGQEPQTFVDNGYILLSIWIRWLNSDSKRLSFKRPLYSSFTIGDVVCIIRRLYLRFKQHQRVKEEPLYIIVGTYLLFTQW